MPGEKRPSREEEEEEEETNIAGEHLLRSSALGTAGVQVPVFPAQSPEPPSGSKKSSVSWIQVSTGHWKHAMCANAEPLPKSTIKVPASQPNSDSKAPKAGQATQNASDKENAAPLSNNSISSKPILDGSKVPSQKTSFAPPRAPSFPKASPPASGHENEKPQEPGSVEVPLGRLAAKHLRTLATATPAAPAPPRMAGDRSVPAPPRAPLSRPILQPITAHTSPRSTWQASPRYDAGGARPAAKLSRSSSFGSQAQVTIFGDDSMTSQRSGLRSPPRPPSAAPAPRNSSRSPTRPPPAVPPSTSAMPAPRNSSRSPTRPPSAAPPPRSNSNHRGVVRLEAQVRLDSKVQPPRVGSLPPPCVRQSGGGPGAMSPPHAGVPPVRASSLERRDTFSPPPLVPATKPTMLADVKPVSAVAAPFDDPLLDPEGPSRARAVQRAFSEEHLKAIAESLDLLRECSEDDDNPVNASGLLFADEGIVPTDIDEHPVVGPRPSASAAWANPVSEQQSAYEEAKRQAKVLKATVFWHPPPEAVHICDVARASSSIATPRDRMSPQPKTCSRTSPQQTAVVATPVSAASMAVGKTAGSSLTPGTKQPRQGVTAGPHQRRHGPGSTQTVVHPSTSPSKGTPLPSRPVVHPGGYNQWGGSPPRTYRQPSVRPEQGQYRGADIRAVATPADQSTLSASFTSTSSQIMWKRPYHSYSPTMPARHI